MNIPDYPVTTALALIMILAWFFIGDIYSKVGKLEAEVKALKRMREDATDISK